MAFTSAYSGYGLPNTQFGQLSGNPQNSNNQPGQAIHMFLSAPADPHHRLMYQGAANALRSYSSCQSIV